jgi:hypothetical protein
MEATKGAYTIHQALWEVPLVQVFWMIVAYAKNQGVEGISSPTQIKNRNSIFESPEFLQREAEFLAKRKKHGKK